ncbi:MAG: Cdc6/Cdc18 family protein [Candidatus Bathyarchaeia archaeon]
MSIFVRKAVFDINYVPPKLPHREREVQQLTVLLSDVFRGIRPANLLILGEFGTGKTVVTRKVIDETEKAARERNLTVKGLYVNCATHDTRMKVVREALSLLGVEYKPGYATDHYLKLFNATCQNSAFTIMILDEADKLLMKKGGDGAELLYFLSRSTPNVTIILLTNKLSMPNFIECDLDSRTRDTLRPRIVEFPDYNREELLTILENRAEEGLRSTAYTSDALARIAEISYLKGLRARGLIDITRRAGELTEEADCTHIDAETIEEATEGYEEQAIMRIISALSPTRRLILYRLQTRDRSTGTDSLHVSVQKEMSTKRVRYSKWNLYKDLHQLMDLGIVKKESRNGRWGKVGYEDYWQINPPLREITEKLASPTLHLSK